MRAKQQFGRCAGSGVPGLDAVVLGGLERKHIYLVEGMPGAGKTTFALQFLLEGARHGERCLYVTLSETERELRSTAHSGKAIKCENMAADILTFDGFPSRLELRDGLSRTGARKPFSRVGSCHPEQLRMAGLAIARETPAKSAGRNEIGRAATAEWLILRF